MMLIKKQLVRVQVVWSMVSAKRLMLLNANGAKLNVQNVEQEK